MIMSGYAYICSAGESFDSVARVVYGDEKYAADLLCSNPEQGLKLRFDGGETLLLLETLTQRTGQRTALNLPELSDLHTRGVHLQGSTHRREELSP